MWEDSCSVTAPGGNKLWATVSWGSDRVVTVTVTGGENAREWKLKPRGASGNSNNIYYETSPQFPFTFTFQATEGGEYIFQVWDDLSWGPYNNDFDTSGFTVSTDDSDDSGDDDEGGGGSSSGWYQIHYVQGEGTTLEVQRTWNESTGESYEGEISTGTRIFWKDVFYILVRAIDGYQNPVATFENFDFFEATTNNDGSVLYRGMMLYSGDITITSSATPIGGGGSGEDEPTLTEEGVIFVETENGRVAVQIFVENGTGWDTMWGPKKEVGSIDIPSEGTFVTVECGFSPDVVLLRHSSGASCGAPFELAGEDSLEVQFYAGGYYTPIVLQVTKQEQGFRIWTDSLPLLTSYATQYVAIKYT